MKWLIELLRDLCPLCIARDSTGLDFAETARAYDQNMEAFGGQCLLCRTWWTHSVQSGLVDPMRPEDTAVHYDASIPIDRGYMS